MARHTSDPYCADDRVIGATGVDIITLPCTCSSLMINFGAANDGFDVAFNLDESFGTTNDALRVKHFAGNQTITIQNYKIRSIRVTAAQGVTWGYLGFVSPRTGLAISVEA